MAPGYFSRTLRVGGGVETRNRREASQGDTEGIVWIQDLFLLVITLYLEVYSPLPHLKNELFLYLLNFNFKTFLYLWDVWNVMSRVTTNSQANAVRHTILCI